ncbi:MAG TPA: acyltransferase, partial [Thermomicrobiaceae bacterium]|nr:acyltransferase [Thermomicrobiaceae bacterium]
MGHAAGPAGRPPQASAFWQHYYATPAPVRRPDRDAAPGARVRLPYLPALDGIRGVAVLAVIVYHARPGWLPAGFLGVDIFFVLSGYLITALLLAEWRRSQTIDLPAFWLRRARRLLPALYLLLLVTLAYAAIFKRADLAQLRLDTLAALGYVTNWYLIFRHQSYFQSISDPSLLRNLWSLAVE